MSKQLVISSVISVMIMAFFVLYAPGLAQNVGVQPHGALPHGALSLPQLSGFTAFVPN